MKQVPYIVEHSVNGHLPEVGDLRKRRHEKKALHITCDVHARWGSKGKQRPLSSCRGDSSSVRNFCCLVRTVSRS
jgi:hypothetical protein